MAKVEEFVEKETIDEIKKEVAHYENNVKNNLFTFKVYDCEQEVVNDAIAISRLHFGNKVCDFLKFAVESFKGKHNETEEILAEILLEIEKLKQKKEEPVVEKTGIKTFGGLI